MLSFSENPEKYATGSTKAKEKIQYLESIKHKYTEGQLAIHIKSMEKYEAALKANDTRKLMPFIEKTARNITLRDAFNSHRSVEILYKGTSRTVDPYSLNETYLVAFCHSANDIRTFRVDRIQGVKLSDEFSFDKPLQAVAQSKLADAPTFKRYGGYRRR